MWQETSRTGPSQGSTSDRPPIDPRDVFEADPKAFEALIRTGVAVAGHLVNGRLSPESDSWMPTDVELDGIAAPLARIAARHTPAVGEASGDIMDGLEAGIVTVGYVMRAKADAKAAAGWEQQGAQNRAAVS